MKPSEIIQQIDYLNKEINSLIEQLVLNKENPQIMDIDLLNQKLIGMYDLSLKLRYKLNLGEVELETEESDLEYFHFEPGSTRFVIDKEEAKSAEVKPEEKIPVPEVEVLSQVTDIEPETEVVEAETEVTETISIEEEAVEIAEPVQETVEEKIPETDQHETKYWTVDKGWINTPALEKKEEPEEIIIQDVEEKVPEEKTESEADIKIEEKPEVEEKKAAETKKPIFESVSKTEKSLNEMLAANKEKTVLAETQKHAFTDFKTAITLNLKISFIRELFHGNEKDYKKMIEFLTKCENYSEARLYMQGEKEKHPEWESKQDLLNHLQELINRKFL
jgi:hypothetical protein